MPLYLYKCPACEAVREDIRCIAERDQGPTCRHPGWAPTDCNPCKMKLQLTPVAGFVKNPAAKS